MPELHVRLADEPATMLFRLADASGPQLLQGLVDDATNAPQRVRASTDLALLERLGFVHATWTDDGRTHRISAEGLRAVEVARAGVPALRIGQNGDSDA